MSADLFVYLDTVQFSKNGYQNRHLIKTPKGATWLTLPVRHQFGASIHEIAITDPRALRKHFDVLRQHYRRTAGFRRWSDDLQAFCAMESDSLCDIAIASTDWMLSKLGVEIPRVRASAIPNVSGVNSSLVASICESLKATEYLSGSGGLAYMNAEDFTRIDCRVSVQQWAPFQYEQTYPEIGFIPNLSVLDLLLNCPDTAHELMLKAGSWMQDENGGLLCKQYW